MDCTALRELLREMGIVGAGGAGFPAYAKLDMRADTVIVNCAECEPLFRVHQQVLTAHTFEILSALSQVMEAVGAKQGIVAMKPKQRETVAAVRAALPSYPQVRAHLLPEIYPAGDEVVLIYETLGRLVPSGGLPIQVGVIVWNVETMYNIYRALTDVQPVTHKYVMIAGEVQTPCTVHVPLGMTVAELVALAGGVTTENPVYLLGGVMTGSLGDTQDVVTKTTNAVLVLPVRHPAARKRMGTPAVQLQRAKSACCFCQMCTDLCPRHLLGHPITPHAFMGAATHEDTHDVRPYLDTRYCSACGLCEMYACTQDLSPRALIVAYKQGLAKKGVRAQEEPPAPEVLPERPYRGVPTKRLIVHLGLSPYNVPAPLADAEISTKRVRVLLRQGIGVAALPTVKAGDTVTAGQRIANAAQDALGVPVHAPIAGRVLEVNAQSLLIQA